MARGMATIRAAIFSTILRRGIVSIVVFLVLWEIGRALAPLAGRGHLHADPRPPRL